MPQSATVFRQIAVLAHPLLPNAISEGQRVADFLHAHGIPAVDGLLNDQTLRRTIGEEQFDLVIALGGDGTMLRAGHLCARHGVPILGINLGHFGFLTELQQDQWADFLPRLLDGQYWLEKRMMLLAEHWRAGRRQSSWDVLNEVVVTRGAVTRPVHLRAEVDGQVLTTYVADALIAATPTGSTAYALAAGGPILPPELRNILLLPVAPHLSIDRAIVLAEGSSVCITVHEQTPVVFSVDGQMPGELLIQDRVSVRAAEHAALFVRFQDPGYFYRNLTPHMNRNPVTGSFS
ncbi:MAG: NAD(+)/NADH kinase [Chloroflexota bacterium]